MIEKITSSKIIELNNDLLFLIIRKKHFIKNTAVITFFISLSNDLSCFTTTLIFHLVTVASNNLLIVKIMDFIKSLIQFKNHNYVLPIRLE